MLNLGLSKYLVYLSYKLIMRDKIKEKLTMTLKIKFHTVRVVMLTKWTQTLDNFPKLALFVSYMR